MLYRKSAAQSVHQFDDDDKYDVRLTQTNELHPIPIVMQVVDLIVTVARIHLTRTLPCLLELGTSSLDPFAMGTTRLYLYPQSSMWLKRCILATKK